MARFRSVWVSGELLPTPPRSDLALRRAARLLARIAAATGKLSVADLELAELSVAQMQPTEALLREYVPRRLKSLGLVKCSNMEMRFSRQGLAFAGQRRPTPGAKSPPPPGRRIELCYLTFGNGIRRAVECHEDGDGRTAMLPTTLAMTPSHRFRLTSSHKTDRPAEAATFELFAHDDPRIDH